MKITKRQLKRIIREEKAKSTKRYDDNPALTGKQDKLPDDLQKAIIDKEEEKNESHHESYLRTRIRKIIREMHPRAAADDAYVAELEEKEDELATQIRHASKDIHGYKDHYDLAGKSIEELEDILYRLAHSPMQRAMDLSDRDEMEDQMGRDQELSRAEMAPQRRGMGRRPSGSKSQRRMESVQRIRGIIRGALRDG